MYFSLLPFSRQRRQIADGAGKAFGGQQGQPRFAALVGKAAAQAVMALDQPAQSRLQGVQIQRAVPLQSHRDVVGGGRTFKTVDEP